MKKSSPINAIWLSIILLSVLTASWLGRMDEITKASFDSAKSAVTLAIGMVGAMALWLGIMKVVEEAGAMKAIAKLIRPVMKRLFPDVPENHPAMSAMLMNISANALGLGNAATPMGIKAMQELDKINPEKETATDAMCLFLAINTSSVTLLPLGVITIRAAAGATDPSAILIPSILATVVSTTVAIAAAKLLSRRKSSIPTLSEETTSESTEESETTALTPPGKLGKAGASLFLILLTGGFVRSVIASDHAFSFKESATAMTGCLIPLLMAGFLLFGYLRGVKVYEAMTDGAKEGFQIAVRIIPFLVAIFVAIGMFRASGALEIMTQLISPITSMIGMPAEALPMALIRPLSGSGAFGIMSETVSAAPDSFLSFLVSTMQGSTETTFYVLAVYFGAVGIKRTRHALPAALLADGAGILAALIFSHMFFSM